jgi:serine O-acetyltransferase
MKEDSFWTIIKADILRYTGSTKAGIRAMIKNWWINDGFLLFFIILFRITHKIKQLKIPLFPTLIELIYAIPALLIGVRISSKAKIGRGLFIGHYGGIFIGPIEMGKYCNVSHEVTIGLGRRGTELDGIPKIGEYVWIGAGAKIFGKIRVGNNVSIGANSVVSKDIPDNAIVVGNPGRIVGYQDNNKNIHNIDE